MVTYNPTEPFSKTTFHGYIQSLHNLAYISDWFHYLDETYMIVSSKDVTSLYKAIFPGIPQRLLLIIEVNPNNAQGWLPKNAWAWIQKYQN